MASLPSNVDRLGDSGTYRYVAYAATGDACRLSRSGTAWQAYVSRTGAYVGKAKTLAAIAAKVAAYKA